MRVNFVGHDVSWPHEDRRTLYQASCKLFEVSQYSHVYTLVKNGGPTLEHKHPPPFSRHKKKGRTFMDIFPHIGRSNNPSLITDKKELGLPVITGEIWSEDKNMAAGSSYGRLFEYDNFQSWNENNFFRSSSWKGKLRPEGLLYTRRRIYKKLETLKARNPCSMTYFYNIFFKGDLERPSAKELATFV